MLPYCIPPQLQVGPYLFSAKKARDWSLLDKRSDDVEDGKATSDAAMKARDTPDEGSSHPDFTKKMRTVLEFTEPWTFWPDYNRVCVVQGSAHTAQVGPARTAD